MATGYSTGHGTITRHTENYCRLAVLIVKGCARILRSLFLRHVESSTPTGHPHSPWTVDEFLSAHKSEICRKLRQGKGQLPRIQECLLFPSYGPTVLEKWDIVLLSLILLEFCNFNNHALLMYLNKMKNVRNVICHRGDASVTNSEFEIYFDQLKICIEKCSDDLADAALTSDMRTLVDNIEHSPLSFDESVRLLKEWYDRDKHIEEALQAVDAKVERIGADVQTMAADVQTTGADVKTMGADVVAMMSKVNIIYDILSKSGAKIDIETNIGMFLKNCEPEKERILSEKLVQMMDPKLRNHPELKDELSDPKLQIIYQVVKEAMEKLLSSEREVSDVSSKCVIICVRCRNYDSFQELLYQSSSGGLTGVFKPVERTIRNLDGYENVELEVFISDEDFWKSMDMLVTNLITAFGFIREELSVEQPRAIEETEHETDDSATDLGTQQPRAIEETERETDDSVTDHGIQDVSILSPAECAEQTGSKHNGTCVLINVKPRSIGEYVHIVERSTSNSMKTALHDLAVVLRDYYQLKDLKIEARPVHAKTLPPGLGHQHLESEITSPDPERSHSSEAGLKEAFSKEKMEPKYAKQAVIVEPPTQLKQLSYMETSTSEVLKRAAESKFSQRTSSEQIKKSEYTEAGLTQEYSLDYKKLIYLVQPKYTETSMTSKELDRAITSTSKSVEDMMKRMKMDKIDLLKTRLSIGKKLISMVRVEEVQIRQKEDTLKCRAGGLCSLPDGGWMVADERNYVLKRLDNSYRVVDRCPVSGCYDVCYITELNVAAVGTGYGHTIELISLGAKMQRLRTIQTNHFCDGVTYNTDKFYVTSLWGQEIYEHDYRDGRQLREICPRDSRGEKRFSDTQYITSSEDGSRLFITDVLGGLFILDTTTASVIHQVYVKYPVGVCLGEDDDVFVATYSGIIHLDRNGTKLSTVITRKMLGGREPRFVSYDKRTARLAVTVSHRHLLVHERPPVLLGGKSPARPETLSPDPRHTVYCQTDVIFIGIAPSVSSSKSSRCLSSTLYTCCPLSVVPSTTHLISKSTINDVIADRLTSMPSSRHFRYH